MAETGNRGSGGGTEDFLSGFESYGDISRVLRRDRPAYLSVIHARTDKERRYIYMFIVMAAYLSFGMIVYKWCGQWVA